MTDKAWAVEALMDIIEALPDEKYSYARLQLGDAVESILHADRQISPPKRPALRARRVH